MLSPNLLSKCSMWNPVRHTDFLGRLSHCQSLDWDYEPQAHGCHTTSCQNALCGTLCPSLMQAPTLLNTDGSYHELNVQPKPTSDQLQTYLAPANQPSITLLQPETCLETNLLDISSIAIRGPVQSLSTALSLILVTAHML